MMNSTTSSLVTTSFRISDPRKYGPTSRSPLLTKLARAMAVRANAPAIQELSGLLRAYLANHEEQPLREALAACPDAYSYALLYGFLAYEACTWTALDGRGASDSYHLFGIPITLHAPMDDGTSNWQPSDWGPTNNQLDLEELRRILDKTGVTAGMRDIAILPHLVDPADVMKLDFADINQLAPELVHNLGNLVGSGKLPHYPWQPTTGGAQWRVLVMAARSRARPRGLDEHNERCTVALNEWAERCFDIPASLRVVTSSPERLVSLLTGKGLHMFNCARLVHLMGQSLPSVPRSVSPFVSVVPTATGLCQGELKFSKGGASCVWELHGRATWDEELHALGALLPDELAGFVRVQLGLGGDAAMYLESLRN